MATRKRVDGKNHAWKSLAVPRYLVIAKIVVALLVVASPAMAQAPSAGNAPYEWNHLFPLLGHKLAARGLKFPLPWGVGLNYAYVNQPIEITKIAVGVNDSPPVDVTQYLKFEEIRSKVHATNARLDLWVLPFLSVYGMGNFIMESGTDVTVSEPFQFNATSRQKGYGGGFGFTAAGGVLGYFVTLDMNWTWNKMEQLDTPVGTFLLTPRIGKNFGQVGPVQLVLWVGAMRQRIESDTRGDIRLSEALGDQINDFKDRLADWYGGLSEPEKRIVDNIVAGIEGPGDPVIHYQLDKAVKYPWNMLVGTEVGLSDAWRLRGEFGFINRTQLVLGVNYRFAGF